MQKINPKIKKYNIVIHVKAYKLNHKKKPLFINNFCINKNQNRIYININ